MAKVLEILKVLAAMQFLLQVSLSESIPNDLDTRILLCKELPGRRTLTLHFFNVTNPVEFQNGEKNETLQVRAAVEEVQERFILSNRQDRSSCSLNLDDMSLNFDIKKQWTIVDDEISDINTVNLPFLRFGSHLCRVQSDYYCQTQIANHFLYYEDERDTRFIESFNAAELFLKGYNISLYKKLLTEAIEDGQFKEGDVKELDQDTFAIFPNLHFPTRLTLNSDDDTFGKIEKVDGESTLNWWASKNESDPTNPICMKLTGTNGDSFYGEITRDTILHYYSEDLCSMVSLKFKRMDTSYGFSAMKFVFTDNFLDTSMCFCPEAGEERENCLDQGAIPVKYCQKDMPYIMSLPHFLDASDSYASNIDGMEPNSDLHESYFLVEPVTGSVLESNQKLQLNVDLKRFKYEPTKVKAISFRETILPVYWMEKHFKLDDVHVEAIRTLLKSMAPTTTTTTKETTGKAETTTSAKPPGPSVTTPGGAGDLPKIALMAMIAIVSLLKIAL